MRSSLLNNLCYDKNIQNHLFLFTFTSKNDPVEILAGGFPLQKSVIMFEREQFIIILSYDNYNLQ